MIYIIKGYICNLFSITILFKIYIYFDKNNTTTDMYYTLLDNGHGNNQCGQK